MKEFTHLLAEHDVPVALCIARNGEDIDWGEHLPEEVLYIPEEVFDVCAPGFVELLPLEGYYQTTTITRDLMAALETDLQRALTSDNLTVRDAAKDVLEFLRKGGQMSETHYMAFEGP